MNRLLFFFLRRRERFSDVLQMCWKKMNHEGITDNGSGVCPLSRNNQCRLLVLSVPAYYYYNGEYMTTASGEGLTAPTGQRDKCNIPGLEEFSYMSSAGWMYSKVVYFRNFPWVTASFQMEI